MYIYLFIKIHICMIILNIVLWIYVLSICLCKHTEINCHIEYHLLKYSSFHFETKSLISLNLLNRIGLSPTQLPASTSPKLNCWCLLYLFSFSSLSLSPSCFLFSFPFFLLLCWSEYFTSWAVSPEWNTEWFYKYLFPYHKLKEGIKGGQLFQNYMSKIKCYTTLLFQHPNTC